MPYISPYRREAIDGGEWPKNAGELNYRLTMACLRIHDVEVLESRLYTICANYLGPRFRYQQLNDVIGALEGCRLELIRRVNPRAASTLCAVTVRIYRSFGAPYEDAKIAENGDLVP